MIACLDSSDDDGDLDEPRATKGGDAKSKPRTLKGGQDGDSSFEDPAMARKCFHLSSLG